MVYLSIIMSVVSDKPSHVFFPPTTTDSITKRVI